MLPVRRANALSHRCRPRLAQTLTPKIWMQPILENFFKHNFREDSQIKVVVVEARRREGGIQLDFFDNLGSIPEEKCRELNRVLTMGTGYPWS